jgi:hypothetical protein
MAFGIRAIFYEVISILWLVLHCACLVGYIGLFFIINRILGSFVAEVLQHCEYASIFLEVMVVPRTAKIYLSTTIGDLKMGTTTNIQVTINLSNQDIDGEELQAETLNLLPQLRDLDGVETVDLVEAAEIPDSAKPGLSYVWGILTAKVNPANIGTLLKFLSNFRTKPIELQLKAPDGRELKLIANTQADLAFARQQAEEFLNHTK